MRKITRKIKLGTLTLGGGAPILIQSMTNTDTRNREATEKQILSLAEAGCDVIRFTVPDMESVHNIPFYKKAIEGYEVALVADIHFNYRLAIESAEAGIDKIRINPGNIGDGGRVREVAKICREKNIPIRIGVNGGSLEKEVLQKYGSPCAEALFESAMREKEALERADFYDTVISVKSSDALTVIGANRLISNACDNPLHLGVTEAGTLKSSLVRSSAGLSPLLLEGIGDTIRISITDDVVEEVEAAKTLLSSLGLYNKGGFQVTSCPTCGRTRIDIIKIAKEVEEILKKTKPIGTRQIKVAVMGCAVNGPGEAREADVGIAGGTGEALLFKKGEIIAKVSEEKLIGALINEIENMRNENEA
ncbi:MAG: flavodoxin-dependent (E)-4-hydroxy-3-methylbut-2-enyl-diphosphate synthase [Clostridia bacterium]|nr:flavodoxin-dependent (E)-4-hydroxy-3-methylbut-2-enyl-diphosphate synthase [Clostridia bacterium]